MSDEVILLDTNVLLAATIDPSVLPREVCETLENPRHEVYFSAVGIWEIAIKFSLGRETFDFHPRDIQALALETGFTELPIQSDHCQLVATLPWHHRDPFDRLLIAQAKSLPAYLLTTDILLERYSELVMVVETSGK
ncbi:type II toxin-antitoxin system VapC family toxin [Endothiovibrio diazotrophicus]